MYSKRAVGDKDRLARLRFRRAWSLLDRASREGIATGCRRRKRTQLNETSSPDTSDSPTNRRDAPSSDSTTRGAVSAGWLWGAKESESARSKVSLARMAESRLFGSTVAFESSPPAALSWPRDQSGLDTVASDEQQDQLGSLAPAMGRSNSLSSLEQSELRIPIRRWSQDVGALGSRTRSSSPRSTPMSSPTPSRSTSPRSWSHQVSPTARLRRFSIDTAVAIARKLTTPSTYTTPLRRSILFVISLDPSLLAYFVFSVAAVLSNKYLLRGYFPFPWSLISLQMSCATLAMMTMAKAGLYSPTRISAGDERTVKVVALLFSCEQLSSILGLRLVNVPVSRAQSKPPPLR